MSEKKRISQVPTNIITGFLGTGKTTAILNLLKHKPADEKWAVLVNEFGEIGVDGSLFEGQHGEGEGVFIREVPGGCMCCTAGLSMQIALNILLDKARPDRLLIEPTGLGHPIEVLEVLTGEYYQEALSVNKTITLVDARNLSDNRYTDHQIFNQQIAIADVVVGNKSDLYEKNEAEDLKKYPQRLGNYLAKVLVTENGVIDPSILNGVTRSFAKVSPNPHDHDHDHDEQKTPVSELPIPDSGYLKAENRAAGFKSVGWRFSPLQTFSRDQLVSFINGLSVERLKGVFITETGIFGYNLTSDGLTEVTIDDCIESRVEIIADKIDGDWETQLMDCLTTN